MGTPVAASCVAALQGALDGGFADAAGLAFAAVDPEVVSGIGCARGAALATAIGDDEAVGVFEDVGGEEFLRGFDDLFGVTASEGTDLAEGIELEDKADLGFEDIPDAGEDLLT